MDTDQPTDNISDEEQALIDRFLDDNKLFLGPDPEIMRNHSIQPRTPYEDRLLSAEQDVHQLNHVRGLVSAALDEGFQMVNQMGAAPGARWGDLVTAIMTPTGDLSMIAPHGIIAFASVCHYPIKYINKYWTTDETVGVRDGDGFIHNDARYGGIHNTDQSMMMPIFHEGELICWLACTIHEGENGATEPGGLPAAAESRYDEGLKMSPFKVVENFKLKRDLVTFLQNSVRDPKLQLEDMKVKLHVVMRMRERILAIVQEFGRDPLAAMMRKSLEDVETEVRRRIRELPDGTTRVQAFMDSTLRENAIQKLRMDVTVKGDEMTWDFSGCSPQFMNRSVNTNIGSWKSALVTGLLQNIWPDLPHTMALLSPIKVISQPGTIIDAHGEAPQSMSLMPLFKACTIPTIPMAKLGYMLPHRYTSIIAPQYDQAATFIYGGLTQHGEITGNFCGDINGCGQGARATADGEDAISPVFGFMADTGEHEINEEDVPIIRLGAQVLAKDRAGWGKFRGGLGYEQVATVRGSNMFGFMTGCEGSMFSSAQGMFGGYSCPAYQLCKIKDVNVFDIFNDGQTDLTDVEFNIVDLMNKQPFDGGTYTSNDMGMTFEICNEGEIYMICQGSGGGYGDVLERDPHLVLKDVEEDKVSAFIARDLFKVVFDEKTLVLDEAATESARKTERENRLQRGTRFDDFVEEWTQDAPPEHVPYYGSWDDPRTMIIGAGDTRTKVPYDQIPPIMMPDPKDLQIADLKARLAACESVKD